MDLPQFRYHPDPLATGSVARNDAPCQCCGKSRGFLYALTPHCRQEIESLCPWCIADGRAAEKYDATFVDDHPLLQAGLEHDIVEEVTRRTPGFASWQQEEWLSCCKDACEYHGHPSRKTLQALEQQDLRALAGETRFPLNVLLEVIENYSEDGSPAIYQFVCRHCHRVLHYADFE